jgi:integrase/recombinase XerD
MTTTDSTTLNCSKIPPAATEPPASPSARYHWCAEGELKCKGPGCGKPMPAGYYGRGKISYYCSSNCQYRFYLSQRKPVRCTFCKRLFVKIGKAPTRPFCSVGHFQLWRNQQLDRKKAGRFTKLLHEYIDEAAPRNYAKSSLNAIRCDVAAFFDFLNRSKIRSLNSVGPKTISAFLTDLSKRRPKSAGSLAGTLRVFFDWLIFEGRRTKPNPVISKIHSRRVSKRLPRPFSSADLATIWNLLQSQPNAALRLAVALGQEAGLRISEVANLRVEDVDPVRQQAFVRLPNKVRTERWVPFHSKTKSCLEAWLAVRGDRPFDFLLVGPSGLAMSSATLRILLNRLLKPAVKNWSFHRLRHVASSTLYRHGVDGLGIMRTLGWHSAAAMEGYTELLPEQIRESYDRAQQAEEKQLPGSTKSLSLDEFFVNEDEAHSNPL